MKGTIVCCIRDMVIEKFHKDVWQRTLERSGIPASNMFLPMSDIPDETVMKIIENLCKELGVTLEQAADTFGEYWMVNYVPKLYSNFLLGAPTTRDLLLKMDRIHDTVTRTMSNASPPKFKYSWQDDNTLLMTYDSKRNLVPIFKGLVKGVGKYYKEDIQISMKTPSQMEIKFPPKRA